MMPSIPSPELPFFPPLDVFPELDENFDEDELITPWEYEDDYLNEDDEDE